MAEIESAFVTHLKATSTVTDLVAERIYEYEIPSGAREPYIVVRPTTNVRGPWTQTQYGGVARVSVYVYGETAAKVREIGGVVLDLYKQFSGTLTSHTVEYVEVSNARTLFGPDNDYRFLVDLVVHYH